MNLNNDIEKIDLTYTWKGNVGLFQSDMLIHGVIYPSGEDRWNGLLKSCLN